MKTTEATMYLIVSPRDVSFMDTIRYYRRDCINDFIQNSSMTWKESKKYGWKCVKVNAKIEII